MMRTKHARQIRRGIVARRTYDEWLSLARDEGSGGLMHAYLWGADWVKSATALSKSAWWRTARYPTTRNPRTPGEETTP